MEKFEKSRDRHLAGPSVFKVFTRPKMAALLFLGFSSGLPSLLLNDTLKAWIKDAGASISTISAFSLVGIPFMLKFLWAPVLDRFVPPFLGRRRGWIFMSQIALAGAIVLLGMQDPRTGLLTVATIAILIAFLSATQDIAGDAYRSDVLTTKEMGAGASTWTIGYRLGMLATGSLALALADRMSWSEVYFVMAGFFVIGMIASIMAPEPPLTVPAPVTFRDAVVEPFREFFGRTGLRRGILICYFIILYKLSDYFAGNLAVPFLRDMQFSKSDIGTIKTGVGILATIAGTIVGAGIITRLGINRTLWIVGFLQSVSNLGYLLLAMRPEYGVMVGAMVVEAFCAGLVAAGFVSFLMSLCSPAYSASQFALLSSLMGLSANILVAPAGRIQQHLGWEGYFIFTILLGIPGMALLPIFAPWNSKVPLGAAPHEAL